MRQVRDLLHTEGWAGAAALLRALSESATQEDSEHSVELALRLAQAADMAERHAEATGE